MRLGLNGIVVIDEDPPRRVSGRAERASYHPPRSKLAPTQEVAIRASAGDRRLRSLPAELGVKHQTVRATREPSHPCIHGNELRAAWMSRGR